MRRLRGLEMGGCSLPIGWLFEATAQSPAMIQREWVVRRSILGLVLINGVIGLLLLVMPGGPRSVAGIAVTSAVAASTLPASVFFSRSVVASAWEDSSDRERRAAVLFILYADLGYLACLGYLSEPIIRILGSTFFVTVSIYAAHFTPWSRLLSHTALACVIVVAFGFAAAPSVGALTAIICVAGIVTGVIIPPSVTYYFSKCQREVMRDQIVLANTDPLTGLMNRRAFELYVQRLLRDSQSAALGILSIDVDNYKDINDEFGHAEGDLALVHLAQRLIDSTPASLIGTYARTGGDEFAWVGPIGLEALTAHAEAIRLAICNDIRQPHPITVSVGGAAQTRHSGARSSEDALGSTLFVAADTALYSAKDAGKNTCRIEAV